MRRYIAALLMCWPAMASAWPTQAEQNIAGVVLALTVPLAILAAENGQDKLGHCIAGAGSSFVAAKLMESQWAGWRVSIGFAALKELSDQHGGDSDWKDFGATAGCGAVPLLWEAF